VTSEAGHYQKHTGDLRRELREAMDRGRLAELQRVSLRRHLAVSLPLLAALCANFAALCLWTSPWAWIPLGVLQGFLLFNCTVLLHEVVHRRIVRGGSRPLEGLLGWVYALPCGLSKAQFIRWHLDHHAELGSEEKDPKRTYLSPKRNIRRLKLLYFTPALVPIYFRAAAAAARAYEKPLRRRIGLERAVTLGIHLTAALAATVFLGPGALWRAMVFPYLIVFPVAFSLNRLGQHYDIDPEDAARWGTRMRSSPFWDAAFLWSGNHLEHHYFPGVPFYRLRALNRALTPFFERRAIPARGYGWLLYMYLVRNKRPHTKWEGRGSGK